MTTLTVTINEMIATGTYDEKKIAKFHARQMKLNGNNEKVADAMVRIYLHTFEIRVAKRVA
jgi:hypothetical protein